MEFTDAEDKLAEELAHDLGQVLAQPVTATDLRARRDGAAAPVIGLLALAEPRQRLTACQLVAEWERAGSVEREPATPLPAPIAVDFAGLRTGQCRLLEGVQFTPLSDGLAPHEALAHLLSTVVTLVGAVGEAVAVEPGTGFERVPGWVARLRMLARQNELGPQATTDDRGAWVCATHQNAASVYLPAAAADSLWQLVMATVRTYTREALKELGQEVRADLDRRADPQFWQLIDRQQSVELTDHPVTSGNVLQIVRMPRKHGNDIQRGAALLAPGG